MWVTLVSSIEGVFMKRWVTVVAGAVLLSGFSLVAATPAPGTPGQDAAKIEAGKKVYDANKCMTCHAIDGKGMKKYPLDGIGTKLTADDIRSGSSRLPRWKRSRR